MAEILVIEDDIIVQHVHKLMFDKLGHPVDIADTGMAALEILKINPKLTIIFVDLGLPDIDGYDLIKEMRTMLANKKDFPIIALTGYIGEMEKKACLQAGATDVIHKPILINTLRELLAIHIAK